MTEEEMVGWHHQLDGHEFEQALGIGDGQGSLAVLSISSVQLLSRARLFVTHELQHARPTCPSLTPGAYLNSCLLSQ